VIQKYDYENISDEDSENVIIEVTKNLRITESKIQTRIQRTGKMMEKLLELENQMELKIIELEEQKKEIMDKFDRINKTNEELAKKSMKVFKTLQLLSKKFTNDYHNQSLFGNISKSNSMVRLKMKENKIFLDTLSADIFQVIRLILDRRKYQ
jgi:uncharacterized membrane-anchored protein YhcB (DUF1043 family)